jgi:hypothetical protein
MQSRKIDPADRKVVDQFVHFPHTLYRQCKTWVPPLQGEVRRALDSNRHPFYAHSRAAFFLVESEGNVLGRIAVMDHKLQNEFHKIRRAFFGFFDCVDDQQVSLILFQQAIQWARSRNLTSLVGPRGLIGSDGGGILVEGFEHRPALGIPYNFDYYQRLVEAEGFIKDTDHLSGYLSTKHKLPERILEIAEKVKERRGYWIKSFNSRREMRQWIARIIPVHAQAFAASYTFCPPTREEMDMVVGSILSVADPRLIKLVMKDDSVIGFVIAYPDISAGLQRTGGRMVPFGWMYLLYERKRTRWININGVGLRPEFQGKGANALLYYALAESIHQSRYRHADIVMVNETNLDSRSDMEKIGVQWYKRHRSYRLDIR